MEISTQCVIFASPNFLDLRLVCVRNTRMELIDIWPPFPIIIRNSFLPMPEDYDFDAAIMHRNRVCELDLRLTSLQLERWPSAMRDQFPALTHLGLTFHCESRDRPLTPILPDGFLGGSAPNLQSLELNFIPFPALPKLLLTTTQLASLSLQNIPHSGYISPEVMVTSLAVLSNLESLAIGFESPVSYSGRERRRPLPPTRTVLPSLTRFEFQGVSEYLEVLVARLDAPLLDYIWIVLFHQLIFDISQFIQFTRRTTGSIAYNEVRMDFCQFDVRVVFLPQIGTFCKGPNLTIRCRVLEWQLSSLAQLCTSFSPSIYTVEHLYIYSRSLRSQWQDDIENVQWLEVFHPFTALKNLYVSEKFVQGIVTALQALIEESLTDVLPALESVFLEGFQSSGLVQEAIGQFIAARQLSGHPVAVSPWNKPEGL